MAVAKNARKTKAKPLPPVPAHVADAARWPANRIERWAIDLLVPYACNARMHSQEQVERIAAAIAKWGWTNPVLVDEAGMLLAGHGRIMAAKLLGLAEVPVIVARGWSDSDKRAYILADNKIAENAAWDKELLTIELTALAQLPDVDFNLLGFDSADLAKLCVPAADARAESVASSSDQISETFRYQIIIECTDEAHQVALLRECDDRGLKCRVLIS